MIDFLNNVVALQCAGGGDIAVDARDHDPVRARGQVRRAAGWDLRDMHAGKETGIGRNLGLAGFAGAGRDVEKLGAAVGAAVKLLGA